MRDRTKTKELARDSFNELKILARRPALRTQDVCLLDICEAMTIPWAAYHATAEWMVEPEPEPELTFAQLMPGEMFYWKNSDPDLPVCHTQFPKIKLIDEEDFMVLYEVSTPTRCSLAREQQNREVVKL